MCKLVYRKTFNKVSKNYFEKKLVKISFVLLQTFLLSYYSVTLFRGHLLIMNHLTAIHAYVLLWSEQTWHTKGQTKSDPPTTQQEIDHFHWEQVDASVRMIYCVNELYFNATHICSLSHTHSYHTSPCIWLSYTVRMVLPHTSTHSSVIRLLTLFPLSPPHPHPLLHLFSILMPSIICHPIQRVHIILWRPRVFISW